MCIFLGGEHTVDHCPARVTPWEGTHVSAAQPGRTASGDWRGSAASPHSGETAWLTLTVSKRPSVRAELTRIWGGKTENWTRVCMCSLRATERGFEGVATSSCTVGLADQLTSQLTDQLTGQLTAVSLRVSPPGRGCPRHWSPPLKNGTAVL